VLNDEALANISGWWATLPAIGRARGRWCFHEPTGLPQPRQRARYQMPMVAEPELIEDALERHNKSSLFKVQPGPHTEAWKSFALKTTNQVFNHVPEPQLKKADQIWLRVLQKSHTKLLRPGGIEKIEKWSKAASSRQRSALSDLLWTLNDYMTAKRGVTETKVQYGPKQGERAAINLIDPFHSSLGRPSSAPIAHAAQRKLEERKREQEKELLLMAEQARAAVKAAKAIGRTGFSKDDIETLKSNIPMKWPMKERQLESTTMHLYRSITPADRQFAAEATKQTETARPPASGGCGRLLGKPQWHGDAKYDTLWGAAMNAYQPLELMRNGRLAGAAKATAW